MSLLNFSTNTLTLLKVDVDLKKLFLIKQSPVTKKKDFSVKFTKKHKTG